MQLNDKIIGMAIGTRFRANFSVEDNLGQMVDDILYSKNSYFNEKMFPEVYAKTNEKFLYNRETKNYILINNSNVIVEFFFKDPKESLMIEHIEEAYARQVIGGVLHDYGITQINRIGYIRKYLFKDQALSKDFLNKTIGNTIEGASDINLTFSKKYTLSESERKVELNDYFNAIFNVIKPAEKDELQFSIDYQRLFLPALERVAHLNFSDFVDRVQKYNNESFVKWLKENYSLKI